MFIGDVCISAYDADVRTVELILHPIFFGKNLFFFRHKNDLYSWGIKQVELAGAGPLPRSHSLCMCSMNTDYIMLIMLIHHCYTHQVSLVQRMPRVVSYIYVPGTQLVLFLCCLDQWISTNDKIRILGFEIIARKCSLSPHCPWSFGNGAISSLASMRCTPSLWKMCVPASLVSGIQQESR